MGTSRRLLVGTSGYVYKHWRGVLYPQGLPAHAWLPWYARVFPTLELNATFYCLPKAPSVANWYASTPGNFVFAAKGSRFLTHMKRLSEVGVGLERFYTPLRELRDKQGPVLWQLPPQMTKPDPERLDRFLAHQPKGIRSVVEFRHPAWYVDEICDVLDAHGAAFCEHDLVPRPPPRVTGGFRYLRFHGAGARYEGRYGKRALAKTAAALQEWAADGHRAYVYFNNDLGGNAIRDGLDFLALLGEERTRNVPELPLSM